MSTRTYNSGPPPAKGTVLHDDDGYSWTVVGAMPIRDALAVLVHYHEGDVVTLAELPADLADKAAATAGPVTLRRVLAWQAEGLCVDPGYWHPDGAGTWIDCVAFLVADTDPLLGAARNLGQQRYDAARAAQEAPAT